MDANISLNIHTKFILSTSGSQSSILKHNHALSGLGLNTVYFTIKENINAETYAALLKAPMIVGGAVTAKKGLKSSIIPYLDYVEPIAEKTRAVNTVINNNGSLEGYNSDIGGFERALRQGIKESGIEVSNAVIYGSGGVSGVAYYILDKMGIDVVMTGRNPDRVEAKIRELNIQNPSTNPGPYDLIVDATPISSSPDFIEAKGFREILTGAKMLFSHNMPEKDGEKNYLEEYCKKNNIHFIPGKIMYDGQLLKQYRLFLSNLPSMEKEHITDEAIIEAWKISE